MAEYRDDSKFLTFLYTTVPGRVCLKALAAPGLSRLAGRYLDSHSSRRLIPGFARRNGIDLSICEKQTFDSFNDFFTRRLKPEQRPIDTDPSTLIAPCDGLLSAFSIAPDARFTIKGSSYTVSELLNGDPDWQRFSGGICLVFRLCVCDYHRYHYLDDGSKGENHFIPGKLHTVRPIALANTPVFRQNSREYTLLHTAHFGTVAQIEVGALLVGRIQNHHGACSFRRGEEKGTFLYGGSTIVLLFEPGRVVLDSTADRQERPVRYGQRIGAANAVPMQSPPVSSIL